MEWPLTFKCNNNCISCILDTRQTKNLGDPPISQIENVIDNVPKKEILSFTGGEPTLRAELLEMLKYARKKHPKKFIFVVSNGRRFADIGFVKKLSEQNLEPIRFGIAIYSHRPEVHDAITQAKGSFQETVQGIKNLLSSGFKVELRILVERPNYRELPETAKYIVKNFSGLERVVFINLKYTGNAFINRRIVFVRYSTAVPFVQRAADILIDSGLEVKLFHFPLCIIAKKYWPLAEGTTKQEIELTLLKKCMPCKVKERCPKIWKSYLPLAGESEFNPILET